MNIMYVESGLRGLLHTNWKHLLWLMQLSIFDNINMVKGLLYSLTVIP